MQPAGHSVQVNGKACQLTRTEFDLYQWMRRYRGKIVSRDVLLRNVWGFSSKAETRSVDMCVRRLRAKIGTDSIRTIYGKGYILTIE